MEIRRRICCFALMTVMLTLGCAHTEHMGTNVVGASSPSGSPSENPKEPVNLPAELRLGNHAFRWDGRDLEITTEGRTSPLKLFTAIAADEVLSTRKDDPNTKNCLLTYSYRPMTITTSLIGLESKSNSVCGAISTIGWSYSTMLLTANGKFQYFRNGRREETTIPTDVGLSQLFPEEQLFGAFLANERISADLQRLVARGQLAEKPLNLGELRAAFKKFPYDFLDGKFYLDDGMLDGFVFQHTDGDHVYVWVSLIPIAHGEQALREHLELRLPMPSALREELVSASQGDAGFLASKADQAVGATYARFEFKPNR